MGRLATAYRQAVALHRQALRRWEVARRALAAAGPAPVGSPELVARLARLGGELAAPVPGTARAATHPVPVRLGEATTVDGGFPVLVPLGAGAHLAIDADARDPRVGELLRAVVVRLLAAAPAGTVRVAGIDPAAFGAAFLPLRPLLDAGVLAPAATTVAETTALLDAAERHARTALGAAPEDRELLLVVAASAPPPRELARLAALTHAGPAAAVCVLLAGHPPAGPGEAPPLGATTQLRLNERYALVGDPPGRPFSADGSGLAAPVLLDGDPSHAAVTGLARRLGEAVRRATTVSFADLLPARRWAESSATGLRTVLGRAREPVTVAFDDATPHWLVGGRTGAGKTVFLLDVLYGLAARYSPAELQLFLLDFKEGVSFTEFVPTDRDPSWLPHARAVGIESDREYGVAVLRELRAELGRRADLLKRHGVSKLADLPPNARPPRIVTVVDEFHVLFAGNDPLARQAVDLIEELARKGRSYGLHLVLASQSTTGIEALYGRAEAIFGQFPLRVALPGGGGVLDPLNDAAKTLTVGTAVVNTAGGTAGADTEVHFPDAHAAAAELAALRHELFAARPAGARPPAVFRGYETPRLADDPTWLALSPGDEPPLALVGRTVDVAGSPAGFRLDASPGRHLAVVGTATSGVDVLRSTALSLARQHAPGTARFLLAPLAPGTTDRADDLAMTLAAAGHPVRRLDAAALRTHLADLAAGAVPSGRTYLVVFGMDAAAGALAATDPETFRSGHDDLRAVLRQGPAHGVHLLGWWRGLRRLAEDLGGSQNRDDVACLVALNVPAADLGLHLGVHDLGYAPRDGRALLVDRHEHRTALVVPFAADGEES
ncbi:TraM recognition domain-containing protein [Micromonospora terminaliae]|uniref:TraM recognition domain-containing protein n=1 Tax=Micromonospora terminaliae TaxID=1914461 RepID=A0AAJ2ZG12_9ACTN|nr:FtsK/SpoIIIE domain-containing protein [Micromonospora terminaliae]NES29442.1 TraM recognition domain-containing protein [Micromonospora terminaliae]QGL48461.1 TraM recognition domain-containing protein [Micromonospora terminaliae]